jgi:hypothetical protein
MLLVLVVPICLPFPVVTKQTYLDYQLNNLNSFTEQKENNILNQVTHAKRKSTQKEEKQGKYYYFFPGGYISLMVIKHRKDAQSLEE